MMVAPKNQAALDEAVYAYLAKAIVLHCMRNTCLEDLHAGIYPASATGDYTDVKVVSPYGEIPWNKASRISDAEMRSLMRHCVNRVYTYLLHLETSRGFRIDRRWDPPELDPEMMRDIEAIRADGAINIPGVRGQEQQGIQAVERGLEAGSAPCRSAHKIMVRARFNRKRFTIRRL